MIRFENYDFYYQSKKYLYKDLTMDLVEGKIYGLFGKNGIGKTTLLKAMSGLGFPKSGTIKVDEFVPENRQPDFLSHVFYVPDEFGLPRLTAKVYVHIYSSYYPNFSEEDFYSYLKSFKVDMHVKLHKLSFGQQKKFLIAFALACNTKYLFMDEPTNGLDIQSKVEFRKALVSIMNDDKTIVISTHQSKDLEQMIDHILILDDIGLVLNSSIYEISQKLAFNFYDQKPKNTNYLNCQPVINGYMILEENVNEVETEVRTEQLMMAVVEHPEKIKTLFKN